MRLGALWIGNEFSTTAAGPTLPGAPTNVVATAGNAQASVAFTQAINNGGSPIQYYTVQSNPGPITATGTVSPIIVPGLTNGTGYIFEADETNLVGTGPWSLYSSSVTPMAPVTAYYVATTGTTGNNGLSTTYPVTLAQAQTLMRASSWIKTAYLLGGTYAMSAPLSLTSLDNGESWLAFPGQVPILDGGGTTTKAFDLEGANNVTIRWLTIQNFTQSGIYFQSTNGTFIDSNTVQDITTPAGLGNNAGIFGGLGNHNLTITHNLVQRVNSNGITCLDSNSTSGTYMSNVSISYNAVYNSMLTDSDGGAISTDNRPYLNTGVLINNNVIGNHGNAGNQTKGIYLDDLSSYTTITNNIVYGTGTDSFQIHGGNNNTIQNNIFDITLSSVLGLYQSTPSQPAGADMTNNVFTENIVYSSANPPSSLWTLSGISNPLVPLVDQTNLYWSTSGTQFVPGAGNGAADTNPTVANPGFVNAAANNYNFVSGPPAITGGSFTPISIASVGPLPNNGTPGGDFPGAPTNVVVTVLS